MQEYVKINKLEDETLKLVQLTPDLYTLQLNKDITIQSHSEFVYWSDLKIKALHAYVEVYFTQSDRNDVDFICYVPEIDWKDESIRIHIYNPTSDILKLNKDQVLGNITTSIPATLTEKPEVFLYYDNEYLSVYQKKPNVINKFTYITTPNENDKIEFEFNPGIKLQ